MPVREGDNATFAVLSKVVARHAWELVSQSVRWRAKQLIRGAADQSESSAEERAIRAEMEAYWQSLGHDLETVGYFYTDAMDHHQYRDAVERAERVWGPLAGKRVLDLGCGWGGLSVALCDAGVEPVFVDLVDAHVRVAKKRVPRGRGYVADARDLSNIREQLGGDYDYVFLHALIEHVGNQPTHRGAADPGLADKAAVVREAASLLRPGGGLYLATGNYNFPLDGEIGTWLFHWLPESEQKGVLEAMGVGADNYGLLTWEQLEAMCADVGLTCEAVESGDNRPFQRLLLLVSLAMRSRLFSSGRLPVAVIQRLSELMDSDPRYMPSWFAYFRKR